VKGQRLILACAMAIGLLLGAAPAQAAFPGSDGRIAFDSDRSGGDHNIFTMNPDGSDVRQLTFYTPESGAALRQSSSADGTRLVYEHRDSADREIYVINADGSNNHLLFADPDYRDFDPSFSPDGRTVIFSRCRADFEACAIYSVKSDGKGLTAITHLDVRNNVFDQQPKFSPDGRTIAFDSANRGGVQSAIYLMSAHGTGVRRVTPTALEAFDPDWSPDGRWLAFDTNCCVPVSPAIWKIHPDGSGLVQLTDQGDSLDFTPRFSPQGDRIVFERANGDFSVDEVWVMNPDGSDAHAIQSDAFVPSWAAATP
jgi:TolB protein